MNTPFSEFEMWGFLKSIVNGLVEIKKSNRICNNVSSADIFIDAVGYYKISEIGIVKDTTIADDVGC